jgi:hypothetical protein
MATARRRFLKIQRGAAATWGTAVAATAIWPGLRSIRWRANETVQLAEKLDGTLAVADGATRLATVGEVQVQGYACPEALPYVLESAYAPATATGDAGTPPAYTRVYRPTLTAEDTPKLATLEVGGNLQSFRINTAVVQSFTLSGQIRGYWEFEARWWGTELLSQAFTVGLSPLSYERMKVQKTKLYIDNASGTMGTTQVTDCWVGFEFESGDCYQPRACIADRLDPEGPMQSDQQPRLTIRFLQSAITQTLLDDLRNDRQKYIRLVVTGATIHDTVTSKIQIDLCANLTEWPEVGETEAEGGLVVPVRFTGTRDNTGSFGKLVEYTIVNKLATLP